MDFDDMYDIMLNPYGIDSINYKARNERYINKIIRKKDKYYFVLKITLSNVYTLDLVSGDIVTHSYVCDDDLCENDVVLANKQVYDALEEMELTTSNLFVIDKKNPIYEYDKDNMIIGNCIISKKDYLSGIRKPFIKERKLIDMISSMEEFLKTHNEKNVYACVDSEQHYEHSGCPGPMRNWTILTMGWKVINNRGIYTFVSGLKSKSRDERMYSSSTSCTNNQFDIKKNDELKKIFGSLKFKELIVKCDLEPDEKITISRKDDIIVIRTQPNEDFKSYFRNFKTSVDDHPYDTSAWGWT